MLCSSWAFTQNNEIERLVNAAFTAYNTGKYEEAIKYFDTVQVHAPAVYTSYLWQGKAYLNLCKYDESIKMAKIGLTFDDRNEELINLLVQNYYFIGNDHLRLNIRKKQYDEAPNNVDCIAAYAYSLFGMGDFKQGVSLLKEAIKIKPNDPSLLNRLGFYLDVLNEKEAGLKLQNQALEATDDDLMKAMIFSTLGKNDKAILILDQLIQNNPAAGFYYNNIKASFLMEQSKFEEAKKMLEKSIKSQVHKNPTIFLIASTNNQLGNYQTVIDDLESIVKKYPHYYSANAVYCWALVEIGQLNEAKKLIDQTIDVKPLRPLAYFVKGLLYEKLNRPEIACENFNKAKERYFEKLYTTNALSTHLNKCSK